jgi:hypothetical protein
VPRDESSHSPNPAGFAYLRFFWTPTPFLFSSVWPYQPVAIVVLVYLQFTWGSDPPLLSGWGVPHVSHCWEPTPSKHAGGFMPHLPSPAGLFIYSSCGEVPLPHSMAEHAIGGSTPPLTPEFRVPLPLCHMSNFSIACLLFRFFLWGRSQSVHGGYADFSQGWLWENHVPPICSPVGLPSGLGAGTWRHRSPPGFSVYRDVGGLCAGWGCGGVKVLPLLGGFS